MVLLEVISFVDFLEVVDICSSYVPFVRIHNNKCSRIGTSHYDVYRKSCKLVNWVYTLVASLFLGENQVGIFYHFGLESSASKTPSFVLPNSKPGSPVYSPPSHGQP